MEISTKRLWEVEDYISNSEICAECGRAKSVRRYRVPRKVRIVSPVAHGSDPLGACVSEGDIDVEGGRLFTTEAAAHAECDRRNARANRLEGTQIW